MKVAVTDESKKPGKINIISGKFNGSTSEEIDALQEETEGRYERESITGLKPEMKNNIQVDIIP